MSSHHIVREKQEPALLILSLEGFEYENLGQILEWSPTVIVQQEIYEIADSLAFKIDDTEPLLKTGIHGIAVSGSVNLADEPAEAFRDFYKKIY